MGAVLEHLPSIHNLLRPESYSGCTSSGLGKYMTELHVTVTNVN